MVTSPHVPPTLAFANRVHLQVAYGSQIMSLNSINKLIFVLAARIEFLNIIKYYLRLKRLGDIEISSMLRHIHRHVRKIERLCYDSMPQT